MNKRIKRKFLENMLSTVTVVQAHARSPSDQLNFSTIHTYIYIHVFIFIHLFISDHMVNVVHDTYTDR